MSNYGRNFEFLQSPDPKERRGRYKLEATQRPQGAPAVADWTVDTDAQGRTTVKLVTGDTAPRTGEHGLIVQEHAFNAYRGLDPVITNPSDFDYCKAGEPVQFISGTDVKVRFKNTEDRTFLGLTDYDGRVMVAGLGATQTVEPGDLIGPGTGNDDDGYWAEVSDNDTAWFIVTAVDNDNGEVEAQMLF